MDVFDKPLTVDQCKEIADKFCKDNDLELGIFEGKNIDGQKIHGYCFAAFNPDDEGKLVGYPLHIIVDHLSGGVIPVRF